MKRVDWFLVAAYALLAVCCLGFFYNVAKIVWIVLK
jgi:hypothetical protein